MKIVIDGVEYFPRAKIALMPMSFGEFLRSARKNVNMTLDSASDAIGCAKSYLWGLENGKSEPSFAMAKRIAEAYSVELITLASYLPNKRNNTY